MKKTAVQFLWDKIALKLSIDQVVEFLYLLEQAKEMEKQQIIDACNLDKRQYDNAEQYYNEQFKNK